MKQSSRYYVGDLPTRSRYVADAIESDILSGVLAPQTRLKSTRALAAAFGVGTKVIVSAMDILEQRNLVIRHARQGVYVKTKEAKSGIRDVLLFAMDENAQESSFTLTMHGLLSFATIAGFDFFTRFVTVSPETHLERLGTELARLEKIGYPDCALIIPYQFQREHVERCLQLPYPVIFVGDFCDGDIPDLSYRRIASSPKDVIRCAVDFACRRGCESIVYIECEHAAQLSYNRQNLAELSRLGRKAGLEVSTWNVPGDTRDLQFTAESMLRNRQVRLRDRQLLLGARFDLTRLQQIAAPEVRVEILNWIRSQRFPTPRYIERDLRPFFFAICELIKRVVAGHAPERDIITVETEAKIYEATETT